MGWINRLVNVFRKDRLTGQIDDELEFHLAARAEANVASGMKPEEARQDARRRFGNPALARENAREANLFAPLEALGQDVRFAARMIDGGRDSQPWRCCFRALESARARPCSAC